MILSGEDFLSLAQDELASRFKLAVWAECIPPEVRPAG